VSSIVRGTIEKGGQTDYSCVLGGGVSQVVRGGHEGSMGRNRWGCKVVRGVVAWDFHRVWCTGNCCGVKYSS